MSTYLITHPHLDHLSGFAINTAAFHATSRPKRLAALPFTVDAIKQHIFNDIIWPNLTDEDGGVGFVTFQRLKEGGDVMVGEGEGRGYIEVCEGLGAKGFKISHGKCMRPNTDNSAINTHRGSLGNLSDINSSYGQDHRNPHSHSLTQSRHMSLSHLVLPDTPSQMYQSPSVAQTQQHWQGDIGNAVDSTAYFIRDIATAREVLIFGDVEPDSLSVAPRLARVWSEAASKIASGVLNGIFMECSYDNSQADAILFGHFAPRHIIAELQVLADMVREERLIRASEKAMRKRKRSAANTANDSAGTSISQPVSEFEKESKRSRSLASRSASVQFRRASVPDHNAALGTESPTPAHNHPLSSHLDVEFLHKAPKLVEHQINAEPPLKGLRVVIIHVKDTLKDGPHVSERILAQLNGHLAELGKGSELGCEFVISESGMDYWF